MNDDQWRAAWRLCESLTQLSESGREAVLDAQSDPELAAAVHVVLRSTEAPGLLDPHIPPPNASIGRYVLGQLVGYGGMGVVYAAEDVELGRKVALKFVSRRATLNPSITDLFIYEAKAASALNHPNIVTVHEIVRSEWGLAIVMELVDGVSLRQLCRHPVKLPDALRFGKQMAQALAAAHAQGIIHRDIKPENVMVRSDGYVKILDFGLARVVPRSAPNPDTNVSPSLPAGTWRYMSPEQARGEPLTTATDIFSLGLVLYEMCAGEHAFAAETPTLTAQAIANHRGPPSLNNTHMAPVLERTIHAMLSARPESRPTAGEVALALDRALEARAAVEERKRGRRWVLIAILSLLCLRGAIILWHDLRSQRDPLITRITSNETENRVTAAAISADGKTLAYADPDGIFLRDVQSIDTRQLIAPPHFRTVKIGWLANRGSLVLSGFDMGTLKPSLWSIAGPNARPVLLREEADNGTVSPDGSRLAFTVRNASEIWVANTDGTLARKLIAGSPADVFPVLFWSANGTRLSFERRRYRTPHKLPDELEDSYDFSYESADALSGKILAYASGIQMKAACALDDGRVFFFRWGLPGDRWTEDLWEVNTAKASGALTGSPRRVTHLPKSSRTFALSASRDGKRLMAIIESNEEDVWVGDLRYPGPELLNPRRLTLNSKSDFPHAWTPDSRRVIFESNRSGNFNLFQQATDERVPQVIAAGPLDEIMAQFTPDGRWLLYQVGKFWDYWSLMRLPREGGIPVKLFDATGAGQQIRCPAIGKAKACVLREARGNQEYVFYALDPILGKGRELARTRWMPSFPFDWDVSPDGKTIAMPYHDVLKGKIRLVSLDGSQPEIDVDVRGAGALRSSIWAVGSDGWFGAAQTQAGDQLVYIDRSGQARLLRETVNRTWAVPSPDGRHLAFVDDGVDSNVWMFERF